MLRRRIHVVKGLTARSGFGQTGIRVSSQMHGERVQAQDEVDLRAHRHVCSCVSRRVLVWTVTWRLTHLGEPTKNQDCGSESPFTFPHALSSFSSFLIRHATHRLIDVTHHSFLRFRVGDSATVVRGVHVPHDRKQGRVYGADEMIKGEQVRVQ